MDRKPASSVCVRSAACLPRKGAMPQLQPSCYEIRRIPPSRAHHYRRRSLLPKWTAQCTSAPSHLLLRHTCLLCSLAETASCSPRPSLLSSPTAKPGQNCIHNGPLVEPTRQRFTANAVASKESTSTRGFVTFSWLQLLSVVGGSLVSCAPFSLPRRHQTTLYLRSHVVPTRPSATPAAAAAAVQPSVR